MIVPIAAIAVGFIAQDASRRRREREEREALERVLALARPLALDDRRRAEDGDAAHRRDAEDASASASAAAVALRDAQDALNDDAGSSGDVDDAARPQCRFCFETHGALISPCMCAGTAAYVHESCLRRWQVVSLGTHGVSESYCRVCGAEFTLPKAPLANRVRCWFNPLASDRLEQYFRVFLQIMLDTIVPTERTVALERPKQLLPLVSFAELRIWARREIRKGNKILRFWARVSNACEWAYSAFILSYLGAISSVAGVDAIAAAVHQNRPSTPAEDLAFRCSRNVFASLVRFSRWLVVRTSPVHRIVAMSDRYPQYSFGEPLRFDGPRGENGRRLEFSVGSGLILPR